MKIFRKQSLPSFSGVTKSQYKYENIDVSKYDLNKEEDRVKTFIDNDWQSPMSSSELALLGFFYFQRFDHVKCIFCGVSIGDFEPDDDVLTEHMKFSPNCPLLKRRETENVPINQNILNQTLPLVHYDECGSEQKSRRNSNIEDRLSFPDYRLPSTRLASFKNWPIGSKQKPENLVEAGFFYSGQSDLVICFSCGVFIAKWEFNDNPWVEHSKLKTSNCSYLKFNHEIVQKCEKELKEKARNLKADQISIAESNNGAKIDFESTCKICLERKSSILLMPCKHMAVCGQCVFGIEDKCPICRQPIKEKISVYYS